MGFGLWVGMDGNDLRFYSTTYFLNLPLLDGNECVNIGFRGCRLGFQGLVFRPPLLFHYLKSSACLLQTVTLDPNP